MTKIAYKPIAFYRGLKADLPTLKAGEPGWCTDTKQLYVGDGTTNRLMGYEVTAAVMEGLFDANTILKADTDDTPVALTVEEQKLIGRITDGQITGLTAAQVRTLLGVEAGATKYPDTGEQAFLDADHTKLDGIEDSADITDAVNIASSIHGADAKETPINADEIGGIDTENANVLKKHTWTNVKAFLKTYFDTLYAGSGTNSDITSMTGLDDDGIPAAKIAGGVESLVNNSIANTLHRHSELVASDGSPDPALSVGASGNVKIGTSSDRANLEVSSIFYGSNQAGGIRISDIGANWAWDLYARSDASGSARFTIGFNDDEAFVVKSSGVGIGTIVPGNPLAVNRSADGVIVDFESADTVEGNVSIADNTTSYNAFVGSHYTQLKDGQKELPVGAVVISTGEIIPCEGNIEETEEIKTEVLSQDAFETVDIEIDLVKEKVGEEFLEYRIIDGQVKRITKPVYAKEIVQKTQLKPEHNLDAKTGKIFKTEIVKGIVSRDVSKKEYFPYVDTTNIVSDKRVYGVWFGKMSDDAKGASFGQDDKPVYLIAQVGLFKIRVTDTNGNIEVGDYLESSSRLMEAQKQTSIQKEAGTIAKAMVNVDWSTVKKDQKLGYKWKLIPCIF